MKFLISVVVEAETENIAIGIAEAISTIHFDEGGKVVEVRGPVEID